MRTWSTGNLDIPVRPPDVMGPGRSDNFLGSRPPDGGMNRPPAGPLVNNMAKRGSVTGIARRDSTSAIDSDNGSVITKWEQLSLEPELFASINKFGVGPPNKIQQRALPFLLRGSDIIAQAPPTQERIAAYVIPALQVALTNRDVLNPVVLLVSTTVDQANQAHRMIRDLGGPIGIRSTLIAGLSTGDISQELKIVVQNKPQVVVGTPQKLHAYFTTPNGLQGSDIRFLVLDEVDQLIARNLHEFVYNIVKLLPNSRSSRITPASAGSGPAAPVGTTAGPSIADSPILGPARKLSAIGTIGTPLRSESSSGSASPPNDLLQEKRTSVERQSALFSNTVPQDVLNLATTIQLREPVRVLVRRDGTVTNIETSPNFRGLRQYYLYLAFTAGGSRQDSVDGGLGIIGSGRGTTSAESIQAREWKLDALVDILEDLDIMQALVHVGSVGSLDAVVYKLASRGFEAIPLHGEMSSATKLSAMSKFKSNPSAVMRQSSTKVLVVYDVHTQELNHLPLIINYDLPKAVEEYTHRTAPAVAPNNYTRGGVIINFVTATGGDVEMLRSIECFHKCPEVPLNLRDLV
ncbi:P-loop containing nucleoside triphosphate hydrolase protein [Cylindrobasidium torrendii FP15055 ss-10]|uniref:RNA helicase n=1 Tax=Cylindrobasidium torrendii FP15055 ss-10 TaxID=1314674 RepID=A0A0D7BTK6_9AGAR|nr:P-loop containing nucleoside triphosphate hydrolase protein [Cylindrobasidium torrendii FP15055 ss-10]